MSEIMNISYFSKIIVLQHGLRCEWNDEGENKFNPSGMLLLLFAKLQQKKTLQDIVWGQKHVKAITDCKNSVITMHNTHHGSLGQYFSFGNNAIYRNINHSTVGQYKNKPRLSKIKTIQSYVIEDLVARELKDGIQSLGAILPVLQDYIAPVFHVAEKLQSIIGNINIKKGKYAEYGIWKSVFCVNAQTTEMHSEDDCSYTVITVPKQILFDKKTKYEFHFQFNAEESIYLDMNNPISFMFSGKCLLHQQMCNNTHENAHSSFINFATYTNKKLFNHVKKSFGRVKNNKN